MSSYYDYDLYEYDPNWRDKYEEDDYEAAALLKAKEDAEYLGEVPWTDRVDD